MCVRGPFSLLSSIFVNDLLDHLKDSGFGVSIDGVYCGAPMYADDLTLISASEKELQHTLDIVSLYASCWRYEINAQKSSILVFGESPTSRQQNRSVRKWLVHNSIIPECDVQRHLGVVRSVHPSSVLRTVEHCSAGRSTFFALNTVGFRFGCLHPTTSYRFYSSVCIPILLYGCELWSLTGCEITILERAHSTILRTIQGLPLRCHSKALQSLMGAPSILSLSVSGN